MLEKANIQLCMSSVDNAALIWHNRVANKLDALFLAIQLFEKKRRSYSKDIISLKFSFSVLELTFLNLHSFAHQTG